MTMTASFKTQPALQKKMKQYRISMDEYSRILKMLGREKSNGVDSGEALNAVEWSLFSALWSEHCSYKSSRVHLKKFAKTLHGGVLGGSGENAGIVDLGDDERIIFKMESHNHPSFIEPYQGAATGVGGILRDIFTMGARPIALANYLCFGDHMHPRMQVLVNEVVRGIAGYGNSVGVPTVTGQTNFFPEYGGNILVNAMAVGLLRPGEKVALSAAKGPGNLVVYVGAKTGKDGVHGAAMASESFAEDSESKKPNVQIGDPYFEKLLIESCLEILQQELVVAIQDMGAAGLTSSSFEMASKGQVGMTIHLDKVPVRDQSIAPDEILLSESQERMLLICEPAKLQKIQALMQKWGLDAVCIGEVIKERKVCLYHRGELLADIDPDLLVEQAPMYERPFEKWQSKNSIDDPNELFKPGYFKNFNSTEKLKHVLSDQKQMLLLSARTPIYRQFDQRVGLMTVRGAESDVAVQMLPDSKRLLAMTVGCRPELMRRDARLGALDACFYPALQMAIKGFTPTAMTDCLNYGNPERKEIMSEFVASVDAIVEASQAIGAPVISGNVSFYNETLGQNIISTPAIGMVGVGLNSQHVPMDHFLAEGQIVYRLNSTEVFLGEGLKFFGELDPAAVSKFLGGVRNLAKGMKLQSAQMVGLSGLAISLLRMTTSELGFKMEKKCNAAELWQASLYQALVAIKSEDEDQFLALAKRSDLRFDRLGVVQKHICTLDASTSMDVREWNQWRETSLRGQIESLA